MNRVMRTTAEASALYFLERLYREHDVFVVNDAVHFLVAAARVLPLSLVEALMATIVNDQSFAPEMVDPLCRVAQVLPSSKPTDLVKEKLFAALAQRPTKGRALARLRLGIDQPYWNFYVGRLGREATNRALYAVTIRGHDGSSSATRFCVDGTHLVCGVDVRAFADLAPVHWEDWSRFGLHDYRREGSRIAVETDTRETIAARGACGDAWTAMHLWTLALLDGTISMDETGAAPLTLEAAKMLTNELRKPLDLATFEHIEVRSRWPEPLIERFLDSLPSLVRQTDNAEVVDYFGRATG